MYHKVPQPSDPQLVNRTQSSAREAWRMFEIIAEFVTATERLQAIHPAVTVFGSARVQPGEPAYADSAPVGGEYHLPVRSGLDEGLAQSATHLAG